MQKKKNFFVALILGILIISLVATYFYIKHQKYLVDRHHLLCEVLKPGMSEDEVIATLKQVGDFTMSRGEWGGGNIALDVNFTDSQVKDRYGFFSVVFFDYKYMRAVISHFDDKPEIICDFYQPL